MESGRLGAFPALAEDTRVDVCVIGAGIAGLSVGYRLAREGRKVVLLDDGPIAGGETERTTAHLANALDDRFSTLEKKFGEEGARLAAESHGAAIDFIQQIVELEKIECAFSRLDGFLFQPPGGPEQDLRDEFHAARRAGLSVEMVRSALEFFDTGPAIRFPNQGQIHPYQYIRGLVEAFLRCGGVIHTGTHVTSVTDGRPVEVKTSAGHTVTCAAAVVATNSPINDRVAIHTKQAPYRTYVVAIRMPSGAAPKALFWDMQQANNPDAYHYVRSQRMADYDLLIVGGEDHKTGQADDALRRWGSLEQWARQRFPNGAAVEFRWSGQVLEPVDGLAFIGRNPGEENVYIATGDSGQGMTHGTIAGMLIPDLIIGKSNPWAKLYDPSRIKLSAAKEFAEENLNVAARYAEHLSPGEIRNVEDLQCDCGAVMRRGLNHAAVYRDEQGEIHELSAICPHLGCIVHWNSAEKSWDCPCHGSRFSRYGEVVNGPANANLEPLGSQIPK